MEEKMILALRQSVEYYVKCEEDVMEDFLLPWKPFEYDRNAIVTNFDQVEKYFYFVYEGVLRGYFIKNGLEYNMGFSYDGEYSGVYDSFVTRAPSTWALEAITPTCGLRIDYQSLMRLFDEHKAIERWGRLFYQRVLVGFGVFVKSILADSAEEKFNRLVRQSPHVLQIIPQKHLASYLGMTPETFSRMRKKAML